jgi:vitamin K-dependent gamma-carboxylase
MTDPMPPKHARAPSAGAPRFARLLGALLAPVDGAWLAAFRVLFGLAMCVSMLRFIAYGWIDEFFVAPAFHFKYWGFAWVEAIPAPQLHALFWVMAALALGIALGLCFRLCAAAFALGFAYLQLIDVATYLNHYYLATLLAVLLALSPAHRIASLDALLRPRLATGGIAPALRGGAMSIGVAPALRGGAMPMSAVQAGWLYLFRFQIGVVYTFAGLAKAQSDWLIHAQPLRIWLGSKTGMPLLGPLFTLEWTALVMSWAGFLFDTGIVWLLLWRRTRPFAYALVIAFHTLTGTLFPIGMFPVIMVLGALVFFSPGWPRKWIGAARRLAGLPARVDVSTPVAPREIAPQRGHLLIAAIAIAYCAFHVAMPLRHLAYSGSVLWHEQGMRWSWRVMVREKNGSITYVVRDKRSGKQWHVSPRRYLTRLQEREMSGQPDLILQLAHHIRREFELRAEGPVEVRVEAFVSLNGRRIRRLIDPDVDLAAIRDGVVPAAWITASPDDPPPHIQPI